MVALVSTYSDFGRRCGQAVMALFAGAIIGAALTAGATLALLLAGIVHAAVTGQSLDGIGYVILIPLPVFFGALVIWGAGLFGVAAPAWILLRIFGLSRQRHLVIAVAVLSPLAGLVLFNNDILGFPTALIAAFLAPLGAIVGRIVWRVYHSGAAV